MLRHAIKTYFKQIAILLAALLAIISVVLMIVSQSVAGYTDNVNRSRLEQISTVVDFRIGEISNIALQLHLSPKLAELKRAEDIFARENIWTTLDYQYKLDNFNYFNSSVFLHATVFSQNSYVIMSRSGQDLASFAKQFSSESRPAGYDAKSFMDLLLKADSSFAQPLAHTTSTSGAQTKAWPYVKWLEMPGYQRKVAVVVMLNISHIDDLMRQAMASERSVMCLADEHGNVIAASRSIGEAEHGYILRLDSQAQNVPSGQYAGYSVPSGSSSHRYVLLADPSESVRALDRLIKAIIFISILCVAGAVAVAAAIIQRDQRILKPIVEMTQAQGGGGSQEGLHAALQSGIRHILEDKKELDAKIREQQNALREVRLNNLLNGSAAEHALEDDPELCAGPPAEDCHDYRDYHYVAVLSIRQKDGVAQKPEKLQRVKSAITRTVELLPQKISTCNLSQNQLALVVSSAEYLREAGRESLMGLLYSSMEEVLANDYGLYITFSVGNVHKGAKALSVSYSEARMCFRSQAQNDAKGGKGICWYKPSAEAAPSYYFPPEFEIQLVNAIRGGKRRLVEELVKNLLDINLIERQLHHEFLTVFLHDFYGAILKVVNYSEAAEDIQRKIYDFYAANVHKIESLEFQQRFLAYVYELTETFDMNKKSHNQALAEKVIAHVYANYSDYDMTLYRVAREFSLSGGYLSTFFKEQSGMNFSDFLLDIRMKKAKQLACETAVSVREIAAQTGYGSANTFCRAFKKHFGISPMQMRTSKAGSA
jgi:AraC-like DNA-binding protein